MEFNAKTDIGKVKENNEDNFLTILDYGMSIFAVADGMGGHDFGEEASSIAIRIIRENCDDSLLTKNLEEFILDLFKKINDEIHKTGLEKNLPLGMGTTLTMAIKKDDKIIIGHVGDSRLYIINDKVRQITKDHSYVEELVDKGMISKKEAKTHPKKNIITRSLGTIKNVKVDLIIEQIQENDYLLLCSDGLSNMIEDYEIKKILEEDKNTNLDDINNKFIKIANDRGGYDNITVITAINK